MAGPNDSSAGPVAPVPQEAPRAPRRSHRSRRIPDLGRTARPGRPAADFQALLAAAARAGERHRSALARERAEAGALMAELLRYPAERRDVLLRNSPRFHTWGL